ncbi:Uncharacterised protein [Mycobacterium tuberculosis]|nr:Uncharacterised protein [Mycobacterium tuberculosis]
MTVELSNYSARDAEEVLIAWFTPLRRSGSAREPGDPLPFTLITHTAGTEDIDLGLADPVVSVHTLCDKALGYANAKNESSITHRRMIRLAHHLDPIPLTDGSIASVEYVKVFQEPIWVPYENTAILRKVGRYTIGLSYERIAS